MMNHTEPARLYTQTAYQISRLVTRRYSTSFSSSTRLFDDRIRPHIYAIYGLVRIADEIVDTYAGADRKKVLDELEKEVDRAIKRSYSANPIVEAFAVTARQYHITDELTAPFFESMRMDTNNVTYTRPLYQRYIYGSAEVVGLMCLKVFCNGDESSYKKLQKGAKALGSAYQKVNFLRDFAADYQRLGRVYFPAVTYDSFDEPTKQMIIADIGRDLAVATLAVTRLPAGSRRAVMLSLSYYEALLEKLKRTPAQTIKQTRIRITNTHKARLLVSAYMPGVRKSHV